METASNIANTSILIPAYYISAGIALYTGILAVVMRFVGRQTTLYLAFAAMCFCAAIYQFSAAGYYMSDTVADAAFALRWQVASMMFFFPVFFSFVARYTGQRRIKPWLAVITLFFGVMLVVNLYSPYSLRFSNLEMIAPLRLPWGETLARFSGTAGFGTEILHVVVSVLILWVIWRSVVQFRRGERRMALFLAACQILLIAANAWGTMIDHGLIDSFYIGGFAFLGLVLMMSISLALELLDQTRRIEANTSELRVAATAFETQEAIMVTDANREILRVNQAFTRITGYSAEDAKGQNPVMLKSDRHNDQFYRDIWDTVARDKYWQGEVWNRRKNGEVYPEWCTITAVTNTEGQITNYIGAFSDISQNKQAEDEIHNLAFYDPLTKLPNRRLMLERLSYMLNNSMRQNHHGAILFIDIDNFKILNNTKGHDLGDLMLIEVAKRLKGCVRIDDTVARLGGDEFVAILEGLGAEHAQAVAQVETVVRKILTNLNQPYFLRDHEYHSSASIGINLFCDKKFALEELLKHADTAMYQAKVTGHNSFCFFDPEMQAMMEARAKLENELRHALPQRQFRLYYQMQVDRSGHLTGAEALLRWQHPGQGLVSPAQFIPIAEETGMILPIGTWVLETACAQIKAWEKAPKTNRLCLSINVSARQFYQPDFVDQVRRILQESAINPALLKFELTESLVLTNINDSIIKMKALEEIGVHFSMDDFGTGYSSLAYLTQLPVSQVKIDQSFVHNIFNKSTDAVIVQAVIGMADNLGMEAVAEGVETEAQYDFLKRHGCTVFQGNLFSKPVPIADFEAKIEEFDKVKL
jgi:diguanylate cyclase (GGDEF)-like protein/PAS domain S-box-containing protein